jgi:hypothetical protein
MVLLVRGNTRIGAVPFYDLCPICCPTCIRIWVLNNGKLEEVSVPLGNGSLTQCVRANGWSQATAHTEVRGPNATGYVKQVTAAWSEQGSSTTTTAERIGEVGLGLLLGTIWAWGVVGRKVCIGKGFPNCSGW